MKIIVHWRENVFDDTFNYHLAGNKTISINYLIVLVAILYKHALLNDISIDVWKYKYFQLGME